MKDLLSKGHYWYKIHRSLMESSAPPFYRQPRLYGLSLFLQEINPLEITGVHIKNTGPRQSSNLRP